MARTKVKDHEKLDGANMLKVIELLSAEPPITKKAACGILNISYNTKRLSTLIEEYQERIIFSKRKRAEMRSKAVTTDDAKYIIEEYLIEGTPMQEISERTFRSAGIIKQTLETNGVPLRETGSSYFNPVVLPDGGYREEYKKGDLVFSARYNTPARIKALWQKDKNHGNVYSIYLLGNQKEHAYQPAYELGDLTHLESNLGIRVQEK